MRTIIDLPQEQLEELKMVCQQKDISRAEAVRQAVKEYLIQAKTSKLHAALADTFGVWKHKNIDGVEYQRALRAEWDGRGWDE